MQKRFVFRLHPKFGVDVWIKLWAGWSSRHHYFAGWIVPADKKDKLKSELNR
ncbi:MAG TPA: hypothetical protein VEA59_02890 [Patescibacteria group bacterium]|nr:hypothetical protein [Patescibacteria group bacterium]